MAYPNVEFWSALREGNYVAANDKFFVLSVVDCGWLLVPTRQLVACDPFVFVRRDNSPCVLVPPGRYRVFVTLADVSGTGDGSELREA